MLNAELVKDNLSKGLPVLITAFSIDPQQRSATVGHAFIADRYKRVRIRKETRYAWVYDETPIIGITKCVPDSTVVSYLDPNIEMIGMNWGWEWYYNISDEWYSLTSDWIKNYYGNIYNFNIDRRIIYINSLNLN